MFIKIRDAIKMQNRSNMQLKLNNVAKVKEAVINVDGITVIAGENNTGKSTIGKTLFTIFNSMCNMDKKILHEKSERLQEILLSSIKNSLINHSEYSYEYRKFYRILEQKLFSGLSETLLNMNIQEREEFLRKLVYDIGLDKQLENSEECIQDCIEKLEAIIHIPDKKVIMEVSTRWFNKVFETQLSPLYDDVAVSEIELKIKDKKCNYKFENNTCIDWDSDINILHEAFYIDNPFVIDYMSNRFAELKVTDEHLVEYLRKKTGIFDNIFESILAKDKLIEINALLSEIVDGEIIKDPNGEYYLHSKNFRNPVNIKNLSTGLKSFALIKKLLENGSLKEKDVLILDEPEIHLHSEWQLAYAEIIVLLQKKFDLTMIITTHSPYFLDAIDVYAAKYEISNKVNYYLAESTGDASSLYDVTQNIDAIYKKLSDPLQKLENMRSKLI